MTWSDYQIALQNGSFDLAFAGFSIPKDGDVSFLLHSTRGTYNYGRYTSATMDSYLDELAGRYHGRGGKSSLFQSTTSMERRASRYQFVL